MSEQSGRWGSGQVSGPRVEWRTTMPPVEPASYVYDETVRTVHASVNRPGETPQPAGGDAG